jgi:CRP/FNR family transcriptional regulator, cyclic AMP receptor protein
MTDFGDAPIQREEESTSLRAKRGEILARILFEKDKVIFREGQDGTDTFVVESGRIGVFKTVEGKPVRLAVLEKGAMFGEMAAITGERRTATTIALEPTVVCKIPRSTMQQKMNSCDPFIRALLAILINNLSRVNERYATTAKAAEKMLSDLKASARVDKGVSPGPSPTAPAAPAKTGAKPA